MSVKSELITMLNKALELEQAAYIQYLTHAEAISGITSSPISEFLKDTAKDEASHASTLRLIINNYLDAEPSMKLASTEYLTDTAKVLKINLVKEQEAVEFYHKIHEFILKNKAGLSDIYESLEEYIRLILIEEQEHVVELKVLIG